MHIAIINLSQSAMKSNLVWVLVIALAQVANATAAPAQAVVSTGESFVEADLLIGERSADGARQAGLALSVRDGWKTYWRSPGEAGVPPTFDWSGSENLADARIDWPVPEVFESFGLRAVGYSGRVVLPVTLVPEDPDRPIRLALDMTLGVCRDICVFEETQLSAEIAPDASGTSAGTIEAALAARPQSGKAAGLEQVSCRVSGSGEDRDFAAILEFDRPLADPYVALEAEEGGWFHGTTARHEGSMLEVESTLSLAAANGWVDRSSLRITVLDRNVTADVQGCGAG